MKPEPLGLLLRACAVELAALSRTADGLHDLLAREPGEGLSDRTVEDAQRIDFLVQHLDALGEVLRLLAASAAEGEVDAARLKAQVPLADLGRRLTGDRPLAAAASGDLDLF